MRLSLQFTVASGDPGAIFIAIAAFAFVKCKLKHTYYINTNNNKQLQYSSTLQCLDLISYILAYKVQL